VKRPATTAGAGAEPTAGSRATTEPPDRATTGRARGGRFGRRRPCRATRARSRETQAPRPPARTTTELPPTHRVRGPAGC